MSKIRNLFKGKIFYANISNVSNFLIVERWCTLLLWCVPICADMMVIFVLMLIMTILITNLFLFQDAAASTKAKREGSSFSIIMFFGSWLSSSTSWWWWFDYVRLVDYHHQQHQNYPHDHHHQDRCHHKTSSSSQKIIVTTTNIVIIIINHSLLSTNISGSPFFRGSKRPYCSPPCWVGGHFEVTSIFLSLDFELDIVLQHGDIRSTGISWTMSTSSLPSSTVWQD